MNTEIEISLSDLRLKYKKIDKLPIILSPCKHLIDEKKKLFRHSTIIIIHGKRDGSTTIEQARVN